MKKTFDKVNRLSISVSWSQVEVKTHSKNSIMVEVTGKNKNSINSVSVKKKFGRVRIVEPDMNGFTVSKSGDIHVRPGKSCFVNTGIITDPKIIEDIKNSGIPVYNTGIIGKDNKKLSDIEISPAIIKITIPEKMEELFLKVEGTGSVKLNFKEAEYLDINGKGEGKVCAQGKKVVDDLVVKASGHARAEVSVDIIENLEGRSNEDSLVLLRTQKVLTDHNISGSNISLSFD
jgi:hypothetical protein